jgi:hypothetical protein
VSQHDLGAYKVTKVPGSTVAMCVRVADVYKFSFDDMLIVVKEGRLYVDDVDYGEVKKKAKIKTYFGDVFVDGKKRDPVPPEEDEDQEP